MNIKGKITQKLPLKSGTSQAGKTWSRGEIVIETEGQYPKKVCMETTAEMHEKMQIGATHTFHLNIESREYMEKWYSSIKCWKYE
jgi:hypothetical protein